MIMFKPNKKRKRRGPNMFVKGINLRNFNVTIPSQGFFRGCDADFEVALEKCTHEVNHKDDEEGD